MKKYIVYAISLAAVVGYAQAPDTLWTKTYGGTADDIGYYLQQTFDGGYIIVGETHSFGAGDADVWLLKTDENGDTVWTRTFGGSEYDAGYAVQQTSDTGYVIVGETNSFGAGVPNILLVKTDVNGNTVWTQTFVETAAATGYAVQQTYDGGYIVAGRVVVASGVDACLLKTDSSGDTLWTQTYRFKMFNSGEAVQQTSDSGYIFTVNGSNFWTGSEGCIHVKTDAVGDTVWTEGFGHLHMYSVQQTSDGEYISTGRDLGLSEQRNLHIVKLDTLGNSLWHQSYGYTWIVDGGRSIQQTSNGDYIVAGYTGSFGAGSSDIWLLRTDANGDTLWSKTYGGAAADEANSVQITADGGYIVAGYTTSFGAGYSDVYLIKTEPDLGIAEGETSLVKQHNLGATIFRGPLQLPEGKKCKVFDITGRVVEPSKIRPGIYFIQIDGKISKKVIKVK